MTKIKTLGTFAVIVLTIVSCTKNSRSGDHLTFASATEALKAVDVQGFKTASRTTTPGLTTTLVNPSVVQTANNTAVYVKQKYQVDLSAYDANTVSILGLYLSLKEMNEPGPSTLHCFLVAVGSIIGLTEAGTIWNTLSHGVVSASTVIGAVKLIAKRVGTVITVAVAVYEVGECLNIW